jgi:hypothetical protein
MTQDTGQQIGSQDENQIPVYMFDDKGKYYYENDYEGYGVFGGKDYYDLVAEMNGYTADNAEEFGGMFNNLRGIGIKLAFGELETKNENGDILFPALVTKPDKFNYKSHNFIFLISTSIVATLSLPILRNVPDFLIEETIRFLKTRLFNLHRWPKAKIYDATYLGIWRTVRQKFIGLKKRFKSL